MDYFIDINSEPNYIQQSLSHCNRIAERPRTDNFPGRPVGNTQ
jgi:hypothetical protein